jgi:hypothetical protein
MAKCVADEFNDLTSSEPTASDRKSLERFRHDKTLE